MGKSTVIPRRSHKLRVTPTHLCLSVLADNLIGIIFANPEKLTQFCESKTKEERVLMYASDSVCPRPIIVMEENAYWFKLSTDWLDVIPCVRLPRI